MRKFLILAFAAAPLLAGCDTIDSHHAREAQTELVGMNRTDLFACAGLPNRSQMIGGYEFDTFDYQPYVSDSDLSLTLPLIGGFSLGSSGNCHATAILKDGKVQEIDYGGNTGGITGHVAECVNIVNNCLDGMKEATGNE